MFTRSRITLITLVLAFYSHAAAADGSFSAYPAQVGSYFEVCAYPHCNPARGSMSGLMDDGNSIEIMRELGWGEWYLVIGGFSSDPGSGYLNHVRLWCDNPSSYYQEIYPTNAYYDSGRLVLYLLSNDPLYTCWLATGPNSVLVIQ
jgi:hypothetical protein